MPVLYRHYFSMCAGFCCKAREREGKRENHLQDDIVGIYKVKPGHLFRNHTSIQYWRYFDENCHTQCHYYDTEFNYDMFISWKIYIKSHVNLLDIILAHLGNIILQFVMASC